jgi:Papain-like cysteine protease AvrRpt2
MHFEYQGMTLWYGTPDTPTPGESVQSGSKNTITVGVQPTDASHKIEVLYRVNQGLTETLVAKWLRNHAASKSQYFKARFPAFHAGDVVEYTVICYCAGRQVPSPEEAEHFAASFRVIGHETEPAPSVAANESLLVKPVTTVAAASLPSEVPPPPDSKVAMPLLSPKLETRINAIKTVLTQEEHQQAVDLALRAANGDMPTAIKNLTEKLPAVSLQKIALAHSLAEWSEDHMPVVKALADQTKLKNLRDVALHFNDVEKLATLIDPKSVPESVVGATDDEKKRNFAVTLRDKLQEREPLATLQRMGQEGKVSIANLAITDGQANKEKGYDQRNDRIAALLQETLIVDSQHNLERGSITLQHTVKYQGDIAQSPFSNIQLAVLFPVFDYVQSNATEVDVIRRILSSSRHEIKQDLSSETYHISVPTSGLIGKKEETIKNFSGFTIKALTTKNINALSFTIPIQVSADSGVFYASTFQAFYIIKNIPRTTSTSTIYLAQDPKASSSVPYDPQSLSSSSVSYELSEVASLLKNNENNLYLINKNAYDKILPEFKTISNRKDDWSLLSIITRFVEKADIDPTDLEKWNNKFSALLAEVLKEEHIENQDNELVQFIGNYFSDLFDFPILIPAIKTLEVAGTFEIKIPGDARVSKDDLLFYYLSFEYLSRGANDLVTSKIVRYNWSDNNNPINENKIHFSFSGAEKIILSSISGAITISVKGFDGTVLWSKDFESNDPALKEVPIVVSQLRPVTLNPSQTMGGSRNTGKKLRGQVIELTKKCSLKDLTVVIQAKKEGDELWRVIAAANTDASGNFSMPYPYGEYTEAQALVSLTPNNPADIPIKDLGNKNETIADDFLYLLVTNPECSESTKKEDCDCSAPKKASRLPDQEDLINSDEYTQDIGGSCVNLSTPNRTLREYNYHAIVRTSDPDVANYTLKKITTSISPNKVIQAINSTTPIQTRFELIRGATKTKRSPVDLDNPILWQDAPDNQENLSIYQAVTIATGHILHFKAVTKADGYSLGALLYSLALAPGQKKQIVTFDSSHTLRADETQQITQVGNLTANLESGRDINSLLGGDVNEFMQGRSSANTSGFSGGLGASGSLGVVGASLGVAGGTANSNSSTSQNSARGAFAHFNEKLRQFVNQNASDFRQLNASVVTNVQEGQNYAAMTEVVANHNHCHALTMMYFEVLRHFAIYQELANVEECVFVPLLMTNFSVENIYKWADVLASHLMPMPSNTYLQPFSWVRRHPLIKGFDANERIKTNYANVDFPVGRYCDENISSISGTLTIRADIPRPKTRFDRILSLPIIRKTVTTPGGVDVPGTIQDNIKGAVISALSFGLFGGPSVKYKTESHEVITRGQIFDLFMTLDENYETVPPSKCIRVHRFDEITIYENDKVKKINFFDGMPDDAKLWDAYAIVLGISRIELLNKFSNNVISDWDQIFYDDIAPLIIKKLINESTIVPLPIGNFDLTNTNKYSGKEQLLKYNFSASTTKTRAEILHIDILYNFNSAIGLPERETLIRYLTLNVENLTINYSTAHYNGRIFSGYVGNDLLDTVLLAPTVSIPTPLNFDEQRNPRNEDIYIVNKLIEHLNSNLEHYNKILWYKLDVNRRFMLLDGFDIQIFNDFGVPIGSRSLASVVKNELMTVVGNSLVFPVAAGYRVSQSYILEKTAEGDVEQVTLFEHYKPLTPVPPYRISVPSRGVFAEAVQGACDACEKVKENSSQDWTKFTTDEPTPIAQLQPPVPTITDWKAAWKEFAPPLINIQNAPAAPEPGAGLAGMTELLGKSGIFKDITGLDANQQNVIRTYLSNQENAKAFAEMAKGMATQQHNTQYTDKIMDTLNAARSSDAINQDEYKKLVKDHIQKQIDGGDAQNQQAAQQNKKQETSPIKSAVDLAQSKNVDVSATESNSEGTKSINVKNKGESSSKANGQGGSSSLKYDFTVPGSIEAIKQQSANACWATVTTMMSNWKKQQSQSVNEYVKGIGAEYVPFIQTGIPIAKLNDFCKAAGLNTEYTNTEFPVSYYYEILQKNGPIWVIDLESDNPKLLHGRLLIGIKGDDSSPTTMFTIIDPASGKQYNEDLPTFVSKTENVVKTLDAIKDVQIPLLIYYKDSYDKSKSTDASKSDATIGQGVTSGPTLINAPSISPAIANFKSTFFSANPKILTSGQFHIRDLVYEEVIKAVDADLAARYDSELKNIWDGMIAVVDGVKSKDLINKINSRGMAVDYPNIVKVYGDDPTATRAWAQDLYKKFWLNDTINTSPSVIPATVKRINASYDLGGIDFKGKPTGEKGACFSSTHALGRKYIKAKGLGSIPANLKISEGQIAGAKPIREGNLDRIVYSSPGALKKVVDAIKLALIAGYPVVCGLLSGVRHNMTPITEIPTPEHYVLVFAYENNVFAFWDSDPSVSNIASFGWDPGFGILVATTDTLSTGWDTADLSAVDDDGNHSYFPKRHRYQVYSVQTLPL